MPKERVTRRQFLGGCALGTAAAAALPSHLAGCSRAPAQPEIKVVPDRLILLTLDTLRSDHLEYFSYPRETAPFLSALSEDSVVFENAYCACSNTTPAHASIFSGLHLPQHKMYHNAHEDLTPGVYTMAQMFQDAGYQTAAFCSTIWMQLMQRGFQTFQTCQDDMIVPGANRRYYYPAEKTVGLAIDWLKQRRPDEKFFLWVHLYDPHDPYLAPSQYQEAMSPANARQRDSLELFWTAIQKKHVEAWPYAGSLDSFVDAQCGYDAEIRYMDAAIRDLYGYCDKSGLNQNTIWIATADHGEGLGGHYYSGHGKHIYNEQLRCYTIVHSPDGRYRPHHVEAPVHHVDLMPTVASIYKCSMEKQAMAQQGVSLQPLLEGERSVGPRLLYSQRRKKIETNFSKDWEKGPIFAVYNNKFKYIYHEHSEDEFFDVRRDPRELKNLINEEHPEKFAMLEQAKSTFGRLSLSGGQAEEQGVTHEHDEALKALGYL